MPVAQGFLDPFQTASAISLELLETAVFPFAYGHALQYLFRSITDGSAVFMIVCSCNVLSDHDVRSVVHAASDLPRNPKQIYGCLGCSAECGRCARTIKAIIDEALGPCAKACCSGCPHSHGMADEPVQEFALAAS
jgi:bacterioferritin-associated ferredoxin